MAKASPTKQKSSSSANLPSSWWAPQEGPARPTARGAARSPPASVRRRGRPEGGRVGTRAPPWDGVWVRQPRACRPSTTLIESFRSALGLHLGLVCMSPPQGAGAFFQGGTAC